MSDSWLVIVAGLIQGLTEFLPISSDGHLALLSHLAPDSELTLTQVIWLHGATLLATLVVMRDDIQDLLTPASSSLIKPLIIACIPTAVIGLILEPMVEPFSASLSIVACGFFLSALMLFLSHFNDQGRASSPTSKQALLIGVAQGLAVLPGVSRSGMTIVSALLLGLAPHAAFRFSFLLSIPTIAGVLLLTLWRGRLLVLSPWDGWAALTACAVGVACLLALRQIVSKARLWLFSFYLLAVAVLCWMLDFY